MDHDARAEVALEYCIKMISTNQLNEQDFEGSSNEESSSQEDSVSEYSEKGGSRASPHHHHSERRDASMGQSIKKPTLMKAWYAQFADKSRAGGFKHDSLLFMNEEKNSKTMFTKLGS